MQSQQHHQVALTLSSHCPTEVTLSRKLHVPVCKTEITSDSQWTGFPQRGKVGDRRC